MKHIQLLFTITALILLVTGCVHEYPETGEPRDVVIHFHHDVSWSQHEVTLTRASLGPTNAPAEGVHARYHLLFFNKGLHGYPVLEREILSEDLSRADFDATVSLPPGDYELYLWSDYADSGAGASFFFNSADHTGIVYSGAYTGSSELRDAFRAQASFSVEATIEDSYRGDVTVNIERPMARYELIATDFKEFLQREITRDRGTAQLVDEKADLGAILREIPLDGYSVKVRYAAYMPNCFDNFRNEPVNSALNVSFDAEIVPLSAEEARIGFDYVMTGSKESSVKIALEIYNPQGERIASTNAFDVPVKRSRNTAVRGKFLTSEGSQGIKIDTSFDGVITIYI